jgi:acyl carrier protein
MSTAVRETVAEVWSQVLGTAVDDDSDFFLLGGHSLLATQMVARLEAALGVRMTMRDVLEHALLSEFTEVVRGRLVTAGSAG